MVDGEINQTGGPSAPDEKTAALARAFDSAWERFIGIEGSRADTEANRKQLAARIVALSRAGETNEATLAQSALIHLCVLAEASRLGNQSPTASGSGGPGASGDPQQTHAQAFSPQTVAAMSAALEQCVETLPLQTPSSALQFLSANILEQASRGEQDPERLSRNALEALRNR
ncbi:hypothetical protein SR870_20575 [Rhodopseudomonas palustris]|uniref:hypothetical protein n=1 Tax=Rhodopseudomonas palustris TaxID=1076 RepID=UPI002ACDCA60|nr:hypothetical protein [Rhodopseudomonas palustris]WQG99047.1 hypothetical protein SR870_20575 [Rhodopseudomonas palustris]